VTERELARGDLAGLEAITAFNSPVFQSYPQITSAVRQGLVPLDAALFAKPVVLGNEIAWTTDLSGPIRGWAELAPAEREALESRRRDLGTNLASLVGTLRRGGTNTKSGGLSHLLETALVIPGVEHFRLVGDCFVLTFWGFRRRGDLGLDPLGAEPPVLPPPPVRRRPLWPWKLGILALLLLALGLWLQFRRGPPVVPVAAPVIEAPVPPRVPPATVVPPAEPKPSEPNPPELPPPPAAPPPPTPPPERPSKPPEPAPAPVVKPPSPHVDLPKQRWEQGDLSVLEGCWTLGKEVGAQKYNLLNMPTETGITRAARLCLDNSGRGRESTVSDFPSGRIKCDAPVTANFDSTGGLTIRRAPVLCNPPRTTYMAALLRCTRRDDSVAICNEASEHGEVFVEFRRAH
jgi:hypothetical protein